MKNFYVILIVVSVVAGLALGYGIWGKDKASFEKLQKTLEEKEVSYSRTLAESEELRGISEELRGKISGLETDNDEFKDILKKIDELISSKVERVAAAPAEVVPTADVVPADAAPVDPEVAPVSTPEAAVEAAPAELAPAELAPAEKAVSTESAPVVEPASTPEADLAPVSEVVPAADAAPADAAPTADAAPAIEPAHKQIPAADAEPFTIPAAPDELVSDAGSAAAEDAAPDGAATSPTFDPGSGDPGSGAEAEQGDTQAAPSLEPVPELKSIHPPVDKAL